MSNKKLNFALIILIITFLCASCYADNQQVIIASAKQPVRIVCSNSKDVHEMGLYLQKFLKARHFAVDAKLYSSYNAKYAGPQWIIADKANFAAVKSGVNAPVFAKNTRSDAYFISVRQLKNGAQLLLVGKTASGVRSAAARMVCKVANYGKKLIISAGKEQSNPFIFRRIIDIGDPSRRQMPSRSPFKDADIETWSLDRLRAYPELFWQFGYNGVEVEEVRGYAAISDEKMPKIRRAIQTLARGAKDRKMYVSLFQWGDCLFKEGETFSWNNVQDRKVMNLFIKDLAEDYGNLIDHFNIHIGDPGGCTRDGCDHYKTPQQVAAAFYDGLKKVNPNAQCSLSTWANGFFWQSCPRRVDMSNYYPPFQNMAEINDFGMPIPDGGKFLDATFMPKQIGIAMNRVYNEDQAKLIVASGRPADVWSWYVGDNEMMNTIWLNMSGIDKIFLALPARARNDIRNYSMELCFHGWPQVINSYVAARKMWNPKEPLKDIEREFCTASFGPSNAEAMVDLYNACENGVSYTIPTPADFGTAEYNARLRAVWAKARNVRFAPDWKPNFALPVPAQKIADMLKARLQLIMAVSQAKQEVDAARKNGADNETISLIKKQAIKNIPVLPIDPIYNQDNSIVGTDDAIPAGFATATFADMINQL